MSAQDSTSEAAEPPVVAVRYEVVMQGDNLPKRPNDIGWEVLGGYRKGTGLWQLHVFVLEGPAS